MPRWLVAWSALSLGIVWAFGLYLVAVSFVAHGEPSFSVDQRAQLTEEYPGGTFINDHAYKWCGGQQWWLIDPRGNESNIGGACIRWKSTR